MHLLLAVDRRFSCDGGRVFTEGPCGPETGERYLKWFDRVTVVGRQGIVPRDVTGLTPVAAPGLDVVTVPNMAGLREALLNRERVRNRLSELIDRCDGVVARIPHQIGVEAAALAQQKNKPLAIDIGGCALDGLRAHGSWLGKVYAPLAYYRARAVVGRASWVSYVTRQFLQSRYPAAPGALTTAISNVDIPAPDESVLLKKIDRIRAGKSPLVIGTIGSLRGQFKGIQHAVAALASVSEQLPPFCYRILGGGDLSRWKGLVEHHGLTGRVVFDGTLPAGERVLEWLDGIDIYLQPSLREGLPRALIEAMSRGCPAIASNIAGIPELLEERWLHPPGDVPRLAKLILEMARNPERAREARVNWVRSAEYSRDAVARKRNQFWSAFRDSIADGT